jgi:hypothetical protein
MRKTTTILCDGCGCSFEKENRYIKQAIKYGRKNYCSLSCGTYYQNKSDNMCNWQHSERNKKNLKLGGIKADEYSPFRIFVTKARSRKRGCDLDPPYIKNLWESQNGKCAVTGVELVLDVNQNANYQASLDRIDSNIGYMKGNVRFTSLSVNWLKSNLNDDHIKEFIEIVKRT